MPSCAPDPICARISGAFCYQRAPSAQPVRCTYSSAMEAGSWRARQAAAWLHFGPRRRVCHLSQVGGEASELVREAEKHGRESCPIYPTIRGQDHLARPCRFTCRRLKWRQFELTLGGLPHRSFSRAWYPAPRTSSATPSDSMKTRRPASSKRSACRCSPASG